MPRKHTGKRGGARPGAGRPLQAHGEVAVNGTLRLYPSTWALLRHLAEATGKTQRDVVAEALEAFALKTRLDVGEIRKGKKA